MKPVVLAIRDLVLRVFDTGLTFVVPTQHRRSTTLLIRLDKLGDYVVWLDAARHLCEALHNRGESVTLLANQEWAALAHSERCFDVVLPVHVRKLRRNLAYRAALIARLRRTGFESVYALRVAKERALEDFLVRAIGAPNRVGVTGVSENISESRLKSAERVYTHLVTVDGSIRAERTRNERVLHELGYAEYRARIPVVLTSRSPVPQTLPQRFAVIVPGGGWAGRRWPIERFKEITEHLWAAHRLTSVVVGSLSEVDLGAYLSQARGRVLDLVGEIPLVELPAILARASIVISNETGPAHLAIASGTDVVCITGGGHFGRFMPDPLLAGQSYSPRLRVVNVELPCYGCNWHCPFVSERDQKPPCLTAISVNAVITALDELLQSRSAISADG